MLGDQRDHVQDDHLGGYAKRQLRGACTRNGCPRDAADGADLCPVHLESERKRAARGMARLRTRRRLKLSCIYCGAKLKRAGGKAPRCPACLIKTDRVPTGVVTPIVTTKADRIAAATSVVTNKSEEGRSRYHGQGERGRPPLSVQNRADLGVIADQLTKGTAALALADSIGPEMPRIQRKEARDAACGELALVARLIVELCERNGFDVDL